MEIKTSFSEFLYSPGRIIAYMQQQLPDSSWEATASSVEPLFAFGPFQSLSLLGGTQEDSVPAVAPSDISTQAEISGTYDNSGRVREFSHL